MNMFTDVVELLEEIEKGDAISIVTNQNLSTIRDYKRNFNIDIKKKI